MTDFQDNHVFYNFAAMILEEEKRALKDLHNMVLPNRLRFPFEFLNREIGQNPLGQRIDLSGFTKHLYSVAVNQPLIEIAEKSKEKKELDISHIAAACRLFNLCSPGEELKIPQQYRQSAEEACARFRHYEKTHTPSPTFMTPGN